jgi:hypothetical protein
MRSSTKAIALTAMLITGFAAIPALYAQEPAPSGEQGSMMMGQDGMSGMMGMMQMMSQMGPMMETCNEMMQAMMAEGADMPAMRPDASPLGSQDNG